MITRHWLFTLATTTLAVLAACDRHHASPTSPAVPGTTVRATSLEISGNSRLSQSGETSQLTAWANGTDGTAHDVTTQAQWTVSLDPAVSMKSPGLVVAERWGISIVTATYGQPSVSGQVEVRVAPADAFLVRGEIRSPSGGPLVGARIGIESAAGRFSMETDPSGAYAVPARGPAVLRFEAKGYEAITRQLVIEHDSSLDLVPHPLAGADLNGVYRVTIHAQTSCDLPPAALTREFEAVVVQEGAEIFVEAQGYQFVAWGNNTGFTGTRDENTVAFVISDDFDDDYILIERIDGLGDLYFSGAATGTIRDRDIDATFNGTLRLGVQVCASSSHRLTLKWIHKQ